MTTRKRIADLTDDRAAERALAAKVVFPGRVETDADYLRNDGADILRVLDAGDPVFNVIAPRRWGKTSFLQRVLRHSEDRQRLACYVNFTHGLETVQSELAECFGVEPTLVSLGEGIPQATERPKPLILLDEGNRQVQEDSEEGDGTRKLLTLLASLAVDEKRIVLCLAETQAFFSALSGRGEGLEVLVSENPIYLRQMPNAAKEAFLDLLRKTPCSKLVDEIGAVPIEGKRSRVGVLMFWLV